MSVLMIPSRKKLLPTPVAPTTCMWVWRIFGVMPTSLEVWRFVPREIWPRARAGCFPTGADGSSLSSHEDLGRLGSFQRGFTVPLRKCSNHSVLFLEGDCLLLVSCIYQAHAENASPPSPKQSCLPLLFLSLCAPPRIVS